MKPFSLILFFLSGLISANAALLRVGLFYGSTITSVEFVVADGNYSLLLSASKVVPLKKGDAIVVTESESGCKVKMNGKNLGRFGKVRFVSLLSDGTMRLKLNRPEPNLFTYDGHFEIGAVKGKLKIINSIELESYVAAVVESEAGENNNAEFLKAQGVLCRTYCLDHLERHSTEGYQLCDQVHCQMYKGKSRFNMLVKEAVLATKNQVLVDAKNKLIIAAYHSNCGGRTLSADSVWSRHVDYLQPVTDTFCLNGRHANWQVTITLKAWKRYLADHGFVLPEPDSLGGDSVYNYIPPGRMSVFTFNAKTFPLKTIRDDWNLKSTWFIISVTDDSLLFSGRGYGHGIGMCQEGAMNMAMQGKSFAEIIGFYYRDVRLADADAIQLLNR